MKKLLIILLLLPCFSWATNYYVSTSGNDANPGTIGSPFRNWQKLRDVLTPGDTGFIRGGTYVPTTATTVFKHCDWDGIVGTSGSPIVIQNYPGEIPIYDFTGFVLTVDDSFAVFMTNCAYLKVKGLRATGFAQISTGAGVSRGWGLDDSPNCTIENCIVDNMGGTGFQIGFNNTALQIINCDSYRNADNFSGYGGADGFGANGGITGTDVTFTNCRAWWNSDDGFDAFNTDIVITFTGCQAFWNGYRPGTFITGGDGNGYKLGPTTTVPLASVSRYCYNSLAFENRETGFNQNTAETQFVMQGNTSIGNGQNGFNFSWYPSYAQPFYNNVAWANRSAEIDEAGGNVAGSNNTWDGVVSVGANDFQNLSSQGMGNPRSADGSIPISNYATLKRGSDLINAGINVGFPYYNSLRSNNPDMGYKQTNTLPELDFKK